MREQGGQFLLKQLPQFIKIFVRESNYTGASLRLCSKESAYSVGNSGSIPGSGRSPREGSGNPLQYTCLGKSHRQRSLVGYSPWGWKESDLHMHAMETVLLPECFAYLLGSFAY